MTNSPLTPAQRTALIDLRHAWPERRIVLIGASALACQMEMQRRRTNDIDLTVVAEQGELVADLNALGWERDKHHEHRWTSPHGVLVDALPASRADMLAGKLTFAGSGHVMNLAGFDLAFKHDVPVSLDTNLHVDVAIIPVVVVLKIAAWLNRPSERDRDLDDLAHVFKEYLKSADLRRWEDELIETGLAYDDQSAFALGRDIGVIVADVHRRLIDSFLAAVSDESSAAHAHFARYFAGEDSSARLSAQLRAFRQGLARK
jgi:predicted nucleotidyltransferase